MCFAVPSASSGPLGRGTWASPHRGIQLLLSSRANRRVNSSEGRPKPGEEWEQKERKGKTAARPWRRECGMRAPGPSVPSPQPCVPWAEHRPWEQPPSHPVDGARGRPRDEGQKEPWSVTSVIPGRAAAPSRAIGPPALRFYPSPVCFQPPAPCLSPMAGAPLASHDQRLPGKDKPLNCCQIR